MRNLIAMGADGISMGKQGLEGLTTVIKLLKAHVVEQRRTNEALVALLAHTERTNQILDSFRRQTIVTSIPIKERQP